MIRLEPCWNCDSELTDRIIIFQEVETKKWFFCCHECDAEGPHKETKEQALESWESYNLRQRTMRGKQ